MSTGVSFGAMGLTAVGWRNGGFGLLYIVGNYEYGSTESGDQ